MDSTDNSSKLSNETASHMARQRLENTEKQKLSGKVTKSISASALSLMIPGGSAIQTLSMKSCDFACPSLTFCHPLLHIASFFCNYIQVEFSVYGAGEGISLKTESVTLHFRYFNIALGILQI